MTDEIEFIPSDQVDMRQNRTVIEVERILGQLQQRPGEWALYSRHRTRGACRSRIHQIRRSRTFEGQPVEFASRVDRSSDGEEPYMLLVRWAADDREG